MDYDYDVQVWLDHFGVIMDCMHPGHMATPDRPCCNAKRYAGMTVPEALKLQQEREARDYNPALMTPYTGGSHD